MVSFSITGLKKSEVINIMNKALHIMAGLKT